MPKTKKVNTKEKWMKVKELLKNMKKLNKSVEQKKESELKNRLEELNTATYRAKYKISKLRSNSLLSGGLLDKDEYMFLKRSNFDEIKIISSPSSSASDSVVVLLRKNKQQFVLKITFVLKSEAVQYNFPDTEAKFYGIMETLVKKKITPHVFMLVGCFNETINRNEINPQFNKWLNKYNTKKKFVYPILTETANDNSEMITLAQLLRKLNKDYNYYDSKQANLVSKIILNLLFQISYTLECFNMIGFKHNDLHFGNIFVLMRPKNIMKGNNELFYRKYKYYNRSSVVKEVLLDNIGLDVRIYDFDRSVKQKNEFRYYDKGLKSRFLRKLYSIGQNASDNHYQDVYKVLCHLYYSKVPESITNFIKSQFKDISALTYGKYYDHNKKTNITIDNPIYGTRYYLLQSKLPDYVMNTNTELLEQLSDIINILNPKGLSVLESFSMVNIVTSSKERLIKVINDRNKVSKAPSDKSIPLPKESDNTKIKTNNSKKTNKNAKPTQNTKLEKNTKQKQNTKPAKNTKPEQNTKPKQKFVYKKVTLKKNNIKSNVNKANSLKNSRGNKVNNQRVCDDNKTKRSKIKTSKVINGKVKRGKLIDPEDKNCMFPFIYKKSQGKGKKSMFILTNKCIQDNFGKYCATERNLDCTAKKVSYCVN